MRLTTLILLVVFVSPLVAEIDVPEEIQSPPNPIVATVDADIPEGAQSKGRWKVEGDAEARIVEAGDHQIYVWAQPGEYVLSYTGMWVDFDAKTFDFVEEKATITVTTEDTPDPGPDPPDPPDPTPGAKQIVMFYTAQRLDNLPQDQRTILTSLVIHKRLEELGHVVRAVLTEESIRSEPPDEYASFVEAVQGDPLPRIAFAPKDGGKVEDHPLPEDYDALVELLGGAE